MADSSNARIEQIADLLVIATAAVMTADPLHANEVDKEQVLELFEVLLNSREIRDARDTGEYFV